MKHINSGYVIIDAGGLDLSSSDPQTIAGAWTMVQDAVATRKPIVACNMVYGEGNPLTPVNCFGWPISSTEFVLVSATLHIHVKNTNVCTVVDVAPQT